MSNDSNGNISALENSTSNWKEDKAVKNWFELLGNERTIENYSRDFPKFLKWVEDNPEIPAKTPAEIIKSRIEQLTTTDMTQRRFWEMQTVKFKNLLEQKNYRMATVHGYLRTIMSFFSKSGVKLQFSRGELKINPSEADKVDNEWIPSNEEVRTLYRLANDARDRAVLLTLYQSGFSEVDAGNMKIETFPFYDNNGNWVIDSTTDLYRKQRREKTNQWQQTCLSREALEEIRIMLQNRGYPKEGYLFISFRGEPLGVRGINEIFKGSYGTVKGECVKKIGLVEKAFNGKSKDWQTKHLRDAYKNGLLRAKLPQEIIDSMFGHKREGAKNDYAIAELTITDSYKEAFKFLTINGYGAQNRKVEELAKKLENEKEEFNGKLAEIQSNANETAKNLNKRIAYLEELLTKNQITFTDAMGKFATMTEQVTTLTKLVNNQLASQQPKMSIDELQKKQREERKKKQE